MGNSDLELFRAIAATAELTGTDLTEAAARVFADDLSAYPLHQVLAALTRCRREVKGRLVLADVISRIDDGRPGPEEAWALHPKIEADSAVITQEMAVAYGAARDLIAAGEMVSARMTYCEVYRKQVQSARDEGAGVQWFLSAGDDKSGRAAAIVEARERRRIGFKQAEQMMLTHAPDRIESLPRLSLDWPQQVGGVIEHIAHKLGENVHQFPVPRQ